MTNANIQTPDWGLYDANGTDYDAIYNNTDQEQEIWNNEQSGLLRRMFSQVSTGMSLENRTLPVFVLERRSLLEMYADFFAHPDELISVAYENSNEKRFLAVLKYYLNSFFPARKSGLAMKPYNPILGETFRCRWTLPGVPLSENLTTGGPFPGSNSNQMTFIAQQVSQQPPISAFYAEHPDSGVSCTAHIYTRSYVAGPSSGGVMNIGLATVRIQSFNETYMTTFPDAFARDIFDTRWFELKGKVTIKCQQTDYLAQIEFLPKTSTIEPHKIRGQIFHPASMRDAVMQLEGDWRGEINIKRIGRGVYQPFNMKMPNANIQRPGRLNANRTTINNNPNQEQETWDNQQSGMFRHVVSHTGPFQLFTNVRAKPEVPKECVSVMQQEGNESRRLWRHLTNALFMGNMHLASQVQEYIGGQPPSPAPLHFDRVGGQHAGPTDAWKYREAEY